MIELLQFMILGLGGGAMYALMGEGLVLVYRGSGTLNLAQGAIGMVGAYAMYEAHNRGIPTWPALVVGVLASALIGLVVQVWVMRPLRAASPLARLIAILGVLLLTQSLALEIWNNITRFLPRLLPIGTVDLGSVYIGQDRLFLVIIAVALTALLHVASNRTRIGRATRAVADDPISAAALHWSPDVIGAVTWSVGGALAGIAAIFVASTTSLSIGTLVMLVIPALCAALLGNFSSFWWTLAGGLGLGVSQTVIAKYVKAEGWADAVPFLVVVIVLVVRGRGLPLRHDLIERLPHVGRGRMSYAATVAWVVACSAVVFVLPVKWLDATILVACLGTVLLSIVTVTGLAGQLSLAQFALAGLSAWLAAVLVSEHGWPFLPAAALGIALAIAVGAIAAIPALRVRGVVLAIASLGFATVADRMIFRNSARTGGLMGLNVGEPSIFGFDIDRISHPERYAVVCIVAFGAAATLLANVRRGPSGRKLLAVRGNERAAASIGLSVTEVKLWAFCVGAGFAGLGGVLLAFRDRTADMTQFDTMSSITITVFGALGGIGYISGAILGANWAPGGWAAQIADLLGDTIARWFTVGAALGVIIIVKERQDGMAATLTDAVGRRFGHLGTRRRFKDSGSAIPNLAAAPVSAAVAEHRVEAKALEIANLAVRFGSTVVLQDVSLTVETGQVVGLIGPNGAGKTTLIDAVTGYVPYEGSIKVGGTELRGLSPHRRAQAGLGRTFQSLELFEDLDVLDNVRVAGEADLRTLRLLKDLIRPVNPAPHGTAVAALRAFGLEDDLHRKPTELSFGRRRLVAMARTVSAAPSVVLLDEPAAGLSDGDSEHLGSLIRELADRWGMAVLLVEHDVSLVFSVCDRVVALDLGIDIANGTPEKVRDDPAVHAAYLGMPADA